MKPHWIARVLLFAAAAVGAGADVTARYTIGMSLSPLVPGQEAAMKALGAALPTSMEIRVKGQKAHVAAGRLVSVADLQKQELTLIDAEGKQYATIAANAYMQAAAAMMKTPDLPPDAKKLFDSIKFDFSSRQTGRSETIQGLQADERELVLSMEMPLPANAPAGMPSFRMRMVMSVWNAKPEELTRVPALTEMAAFIKTGAGMMDVSAGMQQFAQILPGMGPKVREMMDDMLRNTTVLLRTQVSAYMPMLALVAEQMKKEGKPLPPGADPNGPFMQQTMELVEYSTAALDDAIFAVPADYQSAPLAELMKRILPSPPVPPGQTGVTR